ncbi:recombinase family protein [Polaromonas sp. YR568]|uniref:recombinase family protein n=1 Tax=Polaromonas sp. YR568 TaxID=1855301 RepID=UPI00398BD4DF
MLIGYARVSSRKQETFLQLDAFKKAGVQKIFTEKAVSVGNRPELRRAIAAVNKGDVLVVWKLDRVVRSLKELLEILEALQQRGVGFRSLTEPIDTSTPVGEFIVQILGAVAQLERSLIRERAIAGQVAALNRGVRWGGQPRVLTEADAQEVFLLRSTGLFTKATLADMFGVSESTVTRAFVARKYPERLIARRMPVLGKLLNP